MSIVNAITLIDIYVYVYNNARVVLLANQLIITPKLRVLTSYFNRLQHAISRLPSVDAFLHFIYI